MSVNPLRMPVDLQESGLCGKVCALSMPFQTDLKHPSSYDLAWPRLSTPNKEVICVKQGTEISLALKAGLKMIACSTSCTFLPPCTCSPVCCGQFHCCRMLPGRLQELKNKGGGGEVHYCASRFLPEDVSKRTYLVTRGCQVRSLQRHHIMVVAQFPLQVVGSDPYLCCCTMCVWGGGVLKKRTK